MIDYERLKTDLAALGLFALLLFVALSLISYDPLDAPANAVYPLAEAVSNLCGPMGARVANFFMNSLGYACYILIVSAIVFDLRLFSTRPSRIYSCEDSGLASSSFQLQRLSICFCRLWEIRDSTAVGDALVLWVCCCWKRNFPWSARHLC